MYAQLTKDMKKLYQSKIVTKGMENDEESTPIKLSNATQVVVRKKAYNKKKNVVNKSKEVLTEVVSSEGLTSQEPSTIEGNKYEVEVLLVSSGL